MKQNNRDFPLECETLQALQEGTDLVALLGNIAGNKAILQGCDISKDGTSRSEGYVFLKTQSYPQGEVLFFEGGTSADELYVKLEDVRVTAQGYQYPKAYTERSLASGIGQESYSWKDFTRVVTTQQLNDLLTSLQKKHEEDMKSLRALPVGTIQMFAGSVAPQDYLLCDGAQLKQEDYPELYGVIGGSFNAAPSAVGTPYSTPSGYFRVPDLRGRFVVGVSDNDDDYSLGSSGGEKTHLLTAEEIPGHRHVYTDDTNAMGAKFQVSSSLRSEGIMEAGNMYTPPRASAESQGTSANNSGGGTAYLTGVTGGGSAHENRPPYYALSYIIKVK